MEKPFDKTQTESEKTKPTKKSDFPDTSFNPHGKDITGSHAFTGCPIF